jgi:hypothetical protein
MLDLPRYLLGVAEIAVLLGSSTFAASAARSRLLPEFEGAPALLATMVMALALLLWCAELLGSFGWFDPVPYFLLVVLVGFGLGAYLRGWHGVRGGRGRPHPQRPPSRRDRTRGRSAYIPAAIALAIATVVVVEFALDVRTRLGTGMTGFDSTWYHGPFAAGFFQTGDTWSLHFIAPQFLAWFYPANAEVAHAVGMLAFDRDVLSPLLNLGWFLACLLACWCIGRPYRVAPWSLALGAIALSVPALSDQAGEARNDLAATFFLLAAVAVAVNAWVPRREGGTPIGALVVVGLAAGLAAGTKLNFLLPAAAVVLGLALIAPRGARLRALGAAGLAALAGGGYWYLRNLIHTGNPLPWFDRLGPISLPAPDQALGGREGHNVLGYLGDGGVWADWFLPGLHHGLGFGWPLLVGLALAGLLLALGRAAEPLLRVAGATGLALVLAWLAAPTSASGPEGMPQGFESGLRYLAPALALGLALLPATPLLRARLDRRREARTQFVADSGTHGVRAEPGRRLLAAIGLGLVVVAVGLGYPVQRHYLDNRYADPGFTAPGLNAAFAWSRTISGARIATTSTRQYPLFGTDLSNRVQFVGLERPHGGFVAPSSCRAWRRAVNAGDYDYVVASRDRLEGGRPPYPPTARWTEGPQATVVLRKEPTIVFRLSGPLDPSACR